MAEAPLTLATVALPRQRDSRQGGPHGHNPLTTKSDKTHNTPPGQGKEGMTADSRESETNPNTPTPQGSYNTLLSNPMASRRYPSFRPRLPHRSRTRQAKKTRWTLMPHTTCRSIKRGGGEGTERAQRRRDGTPRRRHPCRYCEGGEGGERERRGKAERELTVSRDGERERGGGGEERGGGREGMEGGENTLSS